MVRWNKEARILQGRALTPKQVLEVRAEDMKFMLSNGEGRTGLLKMKSSGGLSLQALRMGRLARPGGLAGLVSWVISCLSPPA